MMLSAEQAQGLAMFLIQGVESEIPITRKVLAAMPQDKLGFQLGEKGRTSKDLMWHTITSDIWFAEGIAAAEASLAVLAAQIAAIRKLRKK